MLASRKREAEYALAVEAKGMRRMNGLLLGFLFAGCARNAPPETAATDPSRASPLVGEPCALSAAPAASSAPLRVYVELATLEGDLATIQSSNPAGVQGASEPRTFSQMLADPRWKTVSARQVIGSDGVRQTFPWDLEPPRVAAECPASERWNISMTPHVTGHSPAMVRVEVEILPALPEAAPRAPRVHSECGAHTTVVVRDQQALILSGFPAPAAGKLGLVTALTPYVIREDADLQRLLECKSKRANVNIAGVRSIPPQAPATVAH